eukprot:TRINITY_DN194_c0_g1_i3.p1 TRINITY_DN194_c0_g1~~TRINITY_DN194_c0_g1_i3.p1  ORF type:complete len:1204 (+),score=277.87 TRINITY_DN194_c0_g1_i3:86-3697(+)
MGRRLGAALPLLMPLLCPTGCGAADGPLQPSPAATPPAQPAPAVPPATGGSGAPPPAAPPAAGAAAKAPPSQQAPPSEKAPSPQQPPPAEKAPPSQRPPPSEKAPPSEGPPAAAKPLSEKPPPEPKPHPPQAAQSSERSPPSERRPPSEKLPARLPSSAKPAPSEKPPGQPQPAARQPSSGKPAPDAAKALAAPTAAVAAAKPAGAQPAAARPPRRAAAPPSEGPPAGGAAREAGPPPKRPPPKRAPSPSRREPAPPPPPAALPPVGAEVEVSGLRTASLKQYNGLRGLVVGHKQGRVGVRLPSPHGTKGFLPDNLIEIKTDVVLDDTPAPPSAPLAPAPAIGSDPTEVPRKSTWVLPEEGPHVGMAAAEDLDSVEGSAPTGRLLPSVIVVKPDDGGDSRAAGRWWVQPNAGGSQKVVDAAHLRARPARGLQVQRLSTGDMCTIIGPHPSDPDLWWTRLGNGSHATAPFADLVPVFTGAGSAPFLVGDRVEVRDRGGSWQLGTVTAASPDVKVRADGWPSGSRWDEIRRPPSAPPPAPEGPPVYAPGDDVEVRETNETEWRRGVVHSIMMVGPAKNISWIKVKTEGRKNPHRWKQIRRYSPPGLTPAPPPPPNMTWPVNLTAIWERTCRMAKCKTAGREQDCEDEWVCTNTSGCVYDVLDKNPCAKRRLHEGDVVILAPGAHDFGSIKGVEVGIIVADAKDEQPFAVRGPYGDQYFYRVDEIVPAWGRSVTWAPSEVLSAVLAAWKGAPTFGAAGENTQGAREPTVVKAKKSVAGADEWLATPEPPPPPVEKPKWPDPPPEQKLDEWSGPIVGQPAPAQPVAAQSHPFAVQPAQAAQPAPAAGQAHPFAIRREPDPAAAAAGAAASAAAALPPPAAALPAAAATNPFAIQRGGTGGFSPGMGSIIVVAPEMPVLSGIYRVSGKHKSAILYRSSTCENKNCVMFVSSGGYWMISHDGKGHTKNVGQVKTGTKAGKSPPHQMKDWQYHDRESKKWTPSANIIVDTVEGMEARKVDWKTVITEHSGSDPTGTPPPPEAAAGGGGPFQMGAGAGAAGAAAVPAGAVMMADPNERRIDPADGKAYTMSEFIAYYHGTNEWNRAVRVAPGAPAPAPAPAPASAAAAPVPAAGAAAAPASPDQTFYKGQAVVAVNDIKLGGTFVVRRGSPGIVSGPSGNAAERRWMVRFLGEFPMPVVVNVLPSDIRPGG